MNVGTESRGKVIFLVVLAVLFLLALPRFFMGGGPKAAGPSLPGTTTPEVKKPTRDTDRRGKWPTPNKAQAVASLDPSLRFDLLKMSEDQKYEGTGRNPFDPNARIPDPIDLGTKKPPVVVDEGPKPPPPPPPIPLKFYGFATQPGQAKRIFLASTAGDDIFVGSEGQVINKRYRIVKINNASVEMEDILNNNNKQTLPLVSQN